MATFVKRKKKNGDVRWTALIRKQGRTLAKTFNTKGAAETWSRATEHFIETGSYAPADRSGMIFADAIKSFLEHRAKIGRPLGKTAAFTLQRLNEQHGLENVDALDTAFWRKHSLDRIAGGVTGATASGDLAYVGSVLKHAKREGHQVDAEAPGNARALLQADGIKVFSNQRTRRISDAELKKLFVWINKNADRTSLPLRDLVEFALCTAMRRGEILALRFDQIDGRVAHIGRKHPTEQDRMERMPLLKANAKWPRTDPLSIIKRQPKGSRVFPYLGDTLGYWFEEACKGAGLQGVVFHLLRHECLSRLAERGMDPLRLALIGGHRDMKSVRRYSKLDPAKIALEK